MNEPRNFYDYRETVSLLNKIRNGEQHEPLTQDELLALLDYNINLVTCCNSIIKTSNERQNSLRAIYHTLSGVRLFRLPFTHIYVTKDIRRIVRAKQIATPQFRLFKFKPWVENPWTDCPWLWPNNRTAKSKTKSTKRNQKETPLNLTGIARTE